MTVQEDVRAWMHLQAEIGRQRHDAAAFWVHQVLYDCSCEPSDNCTLNDDQCRRIVTGVEQILSGNEVVTR